MRPSSRRVGPTFDTLRLMVHPYEDHVAWDLMRISFSGSSRTGSFIAHGVVPLDVSSGHVPTARSLLELVLAGLPPLAEPPASPSGDHGGEPTLDLDFSE